ncbi:methylated-DNA--[protein]-cysteine S-methyltransferase [Erysipelothrix urinaevulpis]|nr:methylated-DNA--[protein]-cysteine S-methyltransferase [Erysipelothrix urinaevulpis]
MKKNLHLYSQIINTDVAVLYALSDNSHLYLLCFIDEKEKKLKTLRQYFTVEISEQPTSIHRNLEKQMNEYFLGNRVEFDVPLKLWGTDFQKKVWKQLINIPYGTTISYEALAHQIGHDKAYRAVGSANGKNNHVILIPCHRVIAKGGKLGGYTGGLHIKERLLAVENIE